MADYVFEARDLTKTFRHRTALDGVSLALERGHIYGFIGNNGAGKTTLMRILMGLAYPTAGEIALFGQTGRRALERQRRRIGALIEQPVAYDGMNARQNLRIERILCRNADKSDVDKKLAALHISPGEVGSGPLRVFSQGMR